MGFYISKALDRGAALLKVDKLATGHNADDIAETVLLNILRGDIARWMHFQLLSVVYSKGLCSKLMCFCLVDWVDALQ